MSSENGAGFGEQLITQCISRPRAMHPLIGCQSLKGGVGWYLFFSAVGFLLTEVLSLQQGPTLASLNLAICEEQIMVAAATCDLYEFTRLKIILKRFDCIDISYRKEPVIHTVMDHAAGGIDDCRTIADLVLETGHIKGHINFVSQYAMQQSLFHKAAQANFPELVARIIADGGTPSYIDKWGRNALHLAAQTTSATLAKTVWSEDNLQVTVKDKWGKIPLMTCVKMTSSPDTDVANRRSTSKHGESCEFLAIKSEIMSMDNEGNTVMHWCGGPVSLCEALLTQQWTTVDGLNFNQTMKQLFVTKKNDDGKYAIHTIAGFKQANAALHWLALNPFALGNSTTTKTPTTTPAFGVQPQAFHDFMDHYVNTTDEKKWIPLHYAARYGITENVQQLLLDASANTEARDNDSRNPLEISMIFGQLHLVPVFMGLAKMPGASQENLDNV